MGLRINTNVSSLQAQRNLKGSRTALQKAMERLSSGSRINSAKDDAAGLAISEGLRSTVRGLRQAIRNANDGIGFLAVADGALAEGTNIAQRVRELAIQAANGALADKDRYNLNLEVQQLIAEFNRIATDTDFNGVRLLNGTFQTTDLQVGSQKGQAISFSIGDARASRMGALATKSGVQYIGTAADRVASIITPLASGSLSINNVSVGGSADDGVSTAKADMSALAIANAINAKSGQTNVTAEANSTEVRLTHLGFSCPSYYGSFSGTTFKINGFAITGTAGSADALVEIINNKTNATGVAAEVVDSTEIKLTAKDGRNIQLLLSADSVETGRQALLFAGVATDAYSYYNFTEFGMTDTSGTGYTDGAAGIHFSDRVDTTGGVNTGSISLFSSADIVIAAASGTPSNALGFVTGNVSIDYNTALDKVDISSQSGAQDALRTLDAVIQSIVKIRAGLGAVQNRLESTVSNLGAVNENLQAAESQIRDTDIASETAELVRAQILQQAGVAVLGQANASSQVALELLRF